ncbi:MAG: helicase-related protein, partial [Gammaproteobacteria bacterium]|nr:helicase-related protein [Gammaproteobacteria bacterium]
RGSHLALSLERLEALCATPLRRIGLSATQKPIEEMANFLVGARPDDRAIVDTGHVRERDLALEIPGSPLAAVMANEVWEEIYDRLAALTTAHRTTLVFVNTRRLAERAARHLGERIGEENVTSHHGSLAREHRLEAEQRLKRGRLRCLVATSSLELGIDIGEVDLVCQLGSPRSIAAFLQRVGRSGHAVGAVPKGRLFPLTRDELVESVALLDAARRGELDRVSVPPRPLDVLAQQIVAEVSAREWDEAELLERLRRAWPYRDLGADELADVVRMLAQGFSTRRGRRGAHLHYDAVNRRLRGRRGARLTAITNGGAIPDQFDYDVILAPEGLRVGTLNEDFAFESLPGDIFQLGNTSYRILRVEQGKVHVEDAKGQPPNIPFWFGEAPGRSDELSHAVSRLRADVDRMLADGIESTTDRLVEAYAVAQPAARQLVEYLAAARAALGSLPTQCRVVFERFFDEAGDMHLVVHAPFGSRINRAWGLALRKRFCRKFNFELQAAALEDTIVLSMSSSHSFPLEEVAGYLKSATVREVLVQALLDAPIFASRWRWNATIALAVRRTRNGRRAPAHFQRADAEDLVAAVFPDQLACAENIPAEREIPHHPLVSQTIADCLHDAMCVTGLEALLARIEAGEVEVLARDLAAPSALAQEILNARPYAFLDDAPAEERRTLAVQSRSFMDPDDAAQLGQLDAGAIARVRAEAWPEAGTPDELHDGLMLAGFVAVREAEQRIERGELAYGWSHLFEALAAENRAAVLTPPGGEPIWIAAERVGELLAVFPDAELQPPLRPLADERGPVSREQGLHEIIRSRLEVLGPVTAGELAQPLAVSQRDVEQSLLALEAEGFVVRGRFTGGADGEGQWCERRLLARIHRYTIKRLRSEIEPVSAAEFIRFLFHWHGLAERGEGQAAVAAALEGLEGYAAAAGAWESDLLPARIDRYAPESLDALCAEGRIAWLRLSVTGTEGSRKSSPVRHTPLALVERRNLARWYRLCPVPDPAGVKLGSSAVRVLDSLRADGASFFVDLVHNTGLLRTQVEEALGELVNWGLVTSDSFTGVRALALPQSRRPAFAPRHRRRQVESPFDRAGRWSLLRRSDSGEEPDGDDAAFLAQVLLRRYGVVFRRVVEREAAILPWRDLLRAYWRMEARGEIRGGRFVQGVTGEQFALPDAVATLRRIRRSEPSGELVAVAAADPLNLTGTLVPGERLAATYGSRIIFRDGVPIAVQGAGHRTGEIRYLRAVDERTVWQARLMLTRRARPASLHAPERKPGEPVI